MLGDVFFFVRFFWVGEDRVGEKERMNVDDIMFPKTHITYEHRPSQKEKKNIFQASVFRGELSVSGSLVLSSVYVCLEDHPCQ